MGGLQHHARRTPRKMRLLPAWRAQAPPVPWLQPWKTGRGNRRREVIPAGLRELQKRLSHDRTDRVTATILMAGVTASIPEKTGHGPEGADLQWLTQDIERTAPAATAAARILPEHHRIEHALFIPRPAAGMTRVMVAAQRRCSAANLRYALGTKIHNRT